MSKMYITLVPSVIGLVYFSLMETLSLNFRLHYFSFSFINDRSHAKGPERPNFSFEDEERKLKEKRASS